MKNTLSSCLVAASMTLLAGPASAALFVSDLSGLAINDPLDGFVDDGSAWTVNLEPNQGDLAYGETVAAQPGFQLGVANDIPTGSATSFSATHSVGIPLVSPTAQPTLVQTTFVIVDSDPNGGFPDRNDYSIGIYDGATLLFSINFEAAQQFQPDGPNSVWNVTWSSGASTTPTTLGVLEEAPYTFTATFGANGGDVDFNLNLNGGLNGTYFSGVLTGLAGATITDYAVTSRVGSGADWGSGVIGVTGITVIPEPSTALFFGLSSLAFLRRRRA